MKLVQLKVSVLAVAILSAAATAAGEKDVFDHESQIKAPDDTTKVVFIADAGTHGGPGNHEFMAGSMLIARTLNANYRNVHAVVHSSKNWPQNLAHADAIVVGLNHGAKAANDPEIFAAVRRGAGFMAIHFGVEVEKGKQGENYTQWMGGYFETFWSVNPWWTPSFKSFPDHPIARGVKPFSVKDEWYYHMRFPADMKGVTPILSDVPPTTTASEKPSGRGGNPDVFRAISAGEPQHMAWAYERPDGGRGFGFTGMHDFFNMANDDFRTVLLNGTAWVSRLDIPVDGVRSSPQTRDELTKLIHEAKAAIAAGK